MVLQPPVPSHPSIASHESLGLPCSTSHQLHSQNVRSICAFFVGENDGLNKYFTSLSKENVWKNDTNHCLSNAPILNPAQQKKSEISRKIECKHTQKHILSPTNAI